MSDIFKIRWKDVLGAAVSAVLGSVLTYLGTLTSIFHANIYTMIDVGALAMVASLIKSFFTDNQGKLLGKWKVK